VAIQIKTVLYLIFIDLTIVAIAKTKIKNRNLGQNLWDLYYKILWIRNLQENDKFCNKLVPSGLDKDTSLDKQTG